MTEAIVYQVLKSDKFSATKRQLVKKHYNKKRKDKEAFLALLDRFQKDLAKNPDIQGSSLEPLPKSIAIPDECRLRKQRWRHLPGLNGQAGYGRCYYLVFDERKIIVLFWIYTHEEYGNSYSQPPTKEIVKEIKVVISYVIENHSV